jgi:hypothetical protein
MRILLSVTVLLCAAVPALAQSACSEPPTPRSVDGANVNADQLRAAVAVVKDFLAQSDVYQNCLVGELEAARTQAGTESHAPDPGLERLASQTHARLAANQRTKEKVGAEINAAIAVFKKTHN